MGNTPGASRQPGQPANRIEVIASALGAVVTLATFAYQPETYPVVLEWARREGLAFFDDLTREEVGQLISEARDLFQITADASGALS